MPLDMIDDSWKMWALILTIVGLLFIINAPIGTIAAVIVIVAALYRYLM